VNDFRATPPEVSLVIACYNEELVIQDSVAELTAILETMRHTWEIIFVDDGSHDRTVPLLQEIIRNDARMTLITHPKNVGRGGTVSDGIRRAVGSVVGFIDIDLETHARYIPGLVDTVERGADLAIARRTYKLRPRLLLRAFLSKAYMFLASILLQMPRVDTETGCKFFNRRRILPVLDEIEDSHWFWDTEVVVRSQLKGYSIVEIPTLFLRRQDLPSTVNVISDTLDYLRKLWRFRRTVQLLRSRNPH
jgi:glycosyltransferase involved in cell wall biosynthesis